MPTLGARKVFAHNIPPSYSWRVTAGHRGAVRTSASRTVFLTGRVTDPSDRIVVGAEIVVHGPARPLAQRSVRTNGEGIYEIPALPVGCLPYAGERPLVFDCTKLESLTMEVCQHLGPGRASPGRRRFRRKSR